MVCGQTLRLKFSHQVSRIAIESSRQASNVEKAYVAFAPLHRGDVSHVEAHDLSQLFLRVTEMLASFAHAVAENNGDRYLLTSFPHTAQFRELDLKSLETMGRYLGIDIRGMAMKRLVIGLLGLLFLTTGCSSAKEGFNDGLSGGSTTTSTAAPTAQQRTAYLDTAKKTPGTIGLAAYEDDKLVEWGMDICKQKSSLDLGDGTIDVIKRNPNDALAQRPELWNVLVDAATTNLCKDA